MAGLPGNEIGRVVVRVSASIDDIRGQVERELRGIRDIEIEVTLDTNALRDKVKAAVKEAGAGQDVKVGTDYDSGDLQQRIKKTTEQLGKSKIKPEFDLDRLNESLRLLKLPKLKVPTDIDTTKFTAKAIRARALATQVLERQSLKAKLDLDAQDFRNKLTEAKANLNTLRTSGAKIRLQADADQLNKEIAAVQRHLAELKNERPTVKVVAEIQQAMAELLRLQGKLNRLDEKDYDVSVKADIAKAVADIAALELLLNKLDKKRVDISVDLDKNNLSKALETLAATTAKGAEEAGAALANGMGVALNGAKALGKVAADEFGKIGKSVDDVSTGLFKNGLSFGDIAQAGMKLFLAIVKITAALFALSAVYILVSELGAAVAGAWGLASTAILAVGPAIGLIGGPIAAIALGMDGIKKAAKSIKPEFDKLKASVSATFEKGLTPVFKQLTQTFPAIEAGANGIANALIYVAQQLTTMVTSIPFLDMMWTAFDNIALAVSGLSPGINDLVFSLVNLMTLTSGFNALTGAINVFAASFRAGVSGLIASGTLQQAFIGLQGVLEAVGRALVGLVVNGVQLFAAAAPGMQHALDAITNFFSRFDYARLGAAVGAVFDGIANALNGIDAGQIERITSGFENLGAALNSADFQTSVHTLADGFAYLIEIGPGVVDFFNTIIDAGSRVISFLSGLGNIIAGTFQTIGALLDSSYKYSNIFDWGAHLGDDLKAAGATTRLGASQIGDAFKQGLTHSVPDVKSGAKNLADASQPPGPLDPPWKAGAATIPPAVQNGLQPVSPAVQGILDQLGPTVTDAFTRLGDQAGTGVAGWADKIRTGFGAVVTGVTDGWNQVGLVFDSAMIGGDTRISAATANWTRLMADGLRGMGDSVRVGFDQIGLVFDSAMVGGDIRIAAATQNWTNLMRQGMTSMSTEIFNGFTQIGTVFDSAMVGGDIRITAATANWARIMRDGMSSLGNAVTEGFANVGTAFDIAMIGGDNRITAGTTNWNTIMAQGMANLATTVTMGFIGVGQAITEKMVQIGAVILAGTQLWSATLAVGLLTMIQYVGTAFTAIGLAFVAGMALVNAIIVVETAKWGESLALGILGMNIAAASAFLGVALAAQAALAVVTTLIASAGLRWVADMAAAMYACASAAAAGMGAISSSVIGSLSTCTAAFAQAGFSMSAAFVSAFAIIVSAAANGMAAVVNAVYSGCAAAVAAANSQVGAMRAAGVNMGAALAEGLESQIGRVEAAGARLAAAASRATAAAAQIASPSRVFIRLGEFTGQGFAIGIDNTVPEVVQGATALAQSVIDAVRSVNLQLSKEPLSVTWDEGSFTLPDSVSRIRNFEAELQGAITSGDVSSIEDRVASALAGWGVEIDSNGLAKLVNKANTRKARRR